MSNITVFSQAGLPAPATLTTALTAIAADVGAPGVAILKMDKTGHWVYGADQTEIDPEGEWAVNPFSFVHGFIAWGDGEVLGEKMVPVTQPLPELDSAPPQSKRGWESQVGMSLKCISGEDAGTEVRYSTTSVGGKRSVQQLAVAIAQAINADQSKPVAVVKLGKDHYQHKSYGRVFTPLLSVQRFVSMEGEAEAAEADAEPGITRRRRG